MVSVSYNKPEVQIPATKGRLFLLELYAILTRTARKKALESENSRALFYTCCNYVQTTMMPLRSIIGF